MPMPSGVRLTVNVRTLLAILLIAVPPLVIDLILVLDRSRDAFIEQSGDYLETLARNVASQASRLVEENVADLRALAARNEILTSVRAANRAHGNRTQLEAEDEYRKVDQQWQSKGAEPVVETIVGNQLAVSLRDYLALNADFTRILVVDRLGVTVAATHKPDLYYHGDQVWWITSYGGGYAGGVNLTDAHWDPITRTDCLAMSVPIVDDQTKRVIGVVRGFMDVASLGALAAQLEPAGRSKAQIVKRDGRIVAARDAVPGTQGDSDEMETVAAALKERPSGHLAVSLRGGGEALLGYSDFGLAKVHPEIDWVAVVVQDSGEAMAALRAVNLRALATSLLAILLVGILAVYFSVHRPKELDPLEELQEDRAPRSREEPS